MEKLKKILAYLFALSLIVTISLYLYIFREQQIDTGLIPNEFTYCGKQIKGINKEYKEIVTWLNENKNGWVLSFVSFTPDHMYKHGAFWVNVLPDAVVVSYKTDYGYPQFIRADEHNLKTSCDNNS